MSSVPPNPFLAVREVTAVSDFTNAAQAGIDQKVQSLFPAAVAARVVFDSIMKLVNPGDAEIRNTAQTQEAATDQLFRVYNELSDDIWRSHAQNIPIPKHFNRDLMQGMQNALQVLEGCTLFVLHDDGGAHWQHGNPLVEGIVREVRVAFADANAIVQHNLDHIAQESQQAAELEGRTRALFGLVQSRIVSLKSGLNGNEARQRNIEDRISWEHRHFQPKYTGPFASWSEAFGAPPNQTWVEQQGRLHGLYMEDETVNILNSIYREHLGGTQHVENQARDLLRAVTTDENNLIDLKSNVQMLFLDVGYLELYVLSPTISFGRLDFLRCVIKLLRSENMKSVNTWLHNNLNNSINNILDLCQSTLSPAEWVDVQRPYQPVDDDDLGRVFKALDKSTAAYHLEPHIPTHTLSPMLGFVRQISVFA